MVNNKEEKKEIKEEKKKRGRRKKDERFVYELNKDQVKFFVDLSKDKKELSKVQELLVRANNKSYGSEILFKDLCLYAVEKLTNKDVEKIQEDSLSEMEKVQRSLSEFNKKNNLELTLGEYLIKKLNLN